MASRFQVFPGKRSGSQVILDEELHYVYVKDAAGPTGASIRYKCSQFNKGCPGRLSHKNGVYKMTKNHNHEGRPEEIHERKLAESCKRRAQSESVALRQIFDEESQKMEAIGGGSFKKLESTLRKRRKLNQPPIPMDIGHIVRSIANYPRYEKTSRNGDFYRHHNSLPDEKGEYLIFISPELQGLLQSGTQISVDASFKLVPQQFCQLLTVHVYFLDHSFPVAYVLMTLETKEAYKAIFEYLATTYNMQPRTVISDFETNLQDVLKETFPNAELVRSWFHYGQSIWNTVKQFGLQHSHTVPIVKKLIGMVLSLPFLPAEHIEETFDQLARFVVMADPAQDIRDRVSEMLDCVADYWIIEVGPVNLSVFQKHQQTNNDHESFHYKLGQQLAQNASVWVLIDQIQTINDIAYSDYSRLQNGKQVSRRRKQKYMSQDPNIVEATRKLVEMQCTPLEFLEATARSFNDFLFTRMQETNIINIEIMLPVYHELVPEQSVPQDNPPALQPDTPVAEADQANLDVPPAAQPLEDHQYTVQPASLNTQPPSQNADGDAVPLSEAIVNDVACDVIIKQEVIDVLSD